jgi:DoxX-like protein
MAGGDVMTKQQAKTAAFWATTILGPTSFVIGGVLGLVGGPEVVDATRHLGYPLYFVTILSTWKLLGAIAITAPGLPRVKEWAYAGFFFDLTAAAISHAAVGDGAGDVVAPLVFLALVAASYLLRPASRRLAGAAAPRASAADVQSATGSDAVLRVRSAA